MVMRWFGVYKGRRCWLAWVGPLYRPHAALRWWKASWEKANEEPWAEAEWKKREKGSINGQKKTEKSIKEITFTKISVSWEGQAIDRAHRGSGPSSKARQISVKNGGQGKDGFMEESRHKSGWGRGVDAGVRLYLRKTEEPLLITTFSTACSQGCFWGCVTAQMTRKYKLSKSSRRKKNE